MNFKLIIVAFLSFALSACVTTAGDDYATDVFDDIHDKAQGGG